MNPDAASAILFHESAIPNEIIDDPTVRRIDLASGSEPGVATAAGPDGAPEPAGWAWYPWRHTLAHIPGPMAFRRTRLDRNRNKLTEAEQDRAGALTIGVIGLSVGHAIAHTIALEGLAGRLRLADFDELELTNLNRVPATIFDIGLNKAVVAARRVAEIDPYLPIDIFTDGANPDNIDAFLDGVDIVIEECDSFAVKVLVRDRCRARGIPVLMETSDRGCVDVERFDLEPDRPLFHGVVGDLQSEDLTDLDPQELTAHAAAILQPGEVSARLAASALEVGSTFHAWPQLGGDVALGGATIAAAIRRLVRGEELASGRVRIDVEAALAGITEPDIAAVATAVAPADVESDPAGLETADLVAYAATRAPSAGNQQPWRLTRAPGKVTIGLDPRRSSSLDLSYRASAVALGAAVFNMRAAATERGLATSVTITGDGPDISATVGLDVGEIAPAVPGGLDAVLRRGTRRPLGDATPLSDNEIDVLTAAATGERTRLAITDDPAGRKRYGAIAATADRIRFLTPELHKEMFGELAISPSTDPLGIDTDSLELPPAMTALFGVLRRDDVMALIADWGLGAPLGADAAARVASSSAVIGLVQHGLGVADYLRAGIVMERVWVAAESLGFAVHPVTPMFLYAHDDDAARALSPRFGDDLVAARNELRELWPLADDEAVTIALRLSRTTGSTSSADLPVSRRLSVAAVSV